MPTKPSASVDASWLARLGGWCFGHGWTTVGVWAVVLVGALTAAGVAGSAFGSSTTVADSESARGVALLAEHFPALGTGGQSGTIVIRSERGVDDPELITSLEHLFATIEAGFPDAAGAPQQTGATIVSPFTPEGFGQIATEGPFAGQLAYAIVNLSSEVDDTASGRIGRLILDHAPELDGVDIVVGGQYLAALDPPKAELVGLAFAVVVLTVALGSVLAMSLPIAVAVAGVGVGIAVTTLTGHVILMPTDTVVLAVMIGLGIGIDYSLFIVSRYREATRAGQLHPTAMVTAIDSAGRAVVFAGATVIVSMLGLGLVGLGWLGGMGVGIAATVLATMAASLTLLPALLGLTRGRLEITRRRGVLGAGLFAAALLGAGLGHGSVAVVWAGVAVAVLALGALVPVLRCTVVARPPRPVERTLAHRWSRRIQRRPAMWSLGALALLILLSAPTLSLQLGWADEGNFPEGSPTREAYDLLSAGFGPGFNGPVLITVTSEADGDVGAAHAAVETLRDRLAAAPGVAEVSAPAASTILTPDGRRVHHLTLVPHTSPQDPATLALVRSLRDEVIPAAERAHGGDVEVLVSGATAADIDITRHLSGRTPVFLAAVLIVSFLVLTVVFRSLLVPAKAVVLNLASVVAAYGVVVAVFQWGWGAGLLGIDAGPINPFVPIMLFAVVFGLSMDYEVFLLSRIREEYLRTGDPRASVADGLASTARVITAAAAVMVVVFGSFMLEDIREVKLFGLGLAVAVLVDASIVRMVLVPATMEMLGARNWWLPGWLDRRLPRVRIEREAHGQPTS